jgi:tRNA(Ile2) C34 agmatinyltransferase TiaS
MRQGLRNRKAEEIVAQPAAPVAPVDQVQVAEPRKPPCPYCGARRSRVKRTDGATRYRWCEGCGRNFSTYESVRN